ncbi:MAG TPA: glycosyltransferase family 2 protein [Terriglobales bacterium]|nr:glycosyltransferase family 2 protein [Terriglobales bacterium]
MLGRVKLSVVLITFNEEANIGRTLESVRQLVADGAGETIVVDSGSTDRTREIAESQGAKVFVEPWKGYAAQKNSAIDKATGDWVLLLDADESVEPGLAEEIRATLSSGTEVQGFWIPRKNHFLGRWIRHGGFWPDPKLRLFRRGSGRVQDRLVHETVEVAGATGRLYHAIVHHSYPTMEDYLDHMRGYADLGAEMIRDKPRWWLWLNRWFNPPLTFLYNYFLRFGFLDGREGLLLHRNHARYVAWKYGRALERSRAQQAGAKGDPPPRHPGNAADSAAASAASRKPFDSR